MLFIFGQSSKGATVGPLLDTHCYECKRTTTWDLVKVTEWFTAYFLRVLPLKSDYYLRCPGCGETLALEPEEAKGVRNLKELSPSDSESLHDELVERLETQQLADKTETQREYLKAQR